MVKYLSEKIADFFIGDTVEYQLERDVYVYGCEVLFSILLNIVVVCSTGVFFGNLFCCMVFFASFAIVRHFSGGYHADTHLKCNLILLVNCIAVMEIILLPVVYEAMGTILCCLAMLLVVVVIYKLAPMDNENKKIPEKKREVLKRKSLMVVIMLELSIGCLWLIETHLSVSILMGLLSAAVSLVMKYIIMRREKRDEKES